ncbi:MAG: hypothetical protein JNM24_17660 [Bdellovibrionaceae bacterium]|nr:hypothetical protein [Pseudobdellovibrionaceae bacterium]
MSVLLGVLLSLIVGFCAFMVVFAWENKADPRLFELIVPVLGAILVSGAWTIKFINTNASEPMQKMVSAVNIEYIGGGQLPIIQGLLRKPVELSENLLWARYLDQWNSVFLNRRTSKNYENRNDADPIHFQFFEYFIFKTMSERFGLGWNHDSKFLVKAPWGRSGGESYGVPEDKLDKFFIKQNVDLKAIPNIFIESDPDKLFQIAVPCSKLRL